MAVRVTEAEVLEIAPGITLTPITAFITAASMVVDDINSRCSKAFDDARLKEIERFLTAHLVYMVPGASAGLKTAEDIGRGDYKVAYAIATLGAGVAGTTFGYNANMLSEGCLAEWDKRQSQVYFSGGA